MKIALIGATGNVGRKILEILPKRGFLITPECFASKHSYLGKVEVRPLSEISFKNYDVAIFASTDEVSKQYVPLALKHCKVIDTSPFFRLNTEVPLIVSPVNGKLLDKNSGFACVANCLASPLAIALKPCLDVGAVKAASITTMQSTSGAGKLPMEELLKQSEKFLQEGYQNLTSIHFDRQIAFNVILQVGSFKEDGYTGEELKIAAETNKILGINIPLSVTAIRVPIFNSHTISITVDFEEEVDLEKLKNAFKLNQNIKFCEAEEYITAIEAVNREELFINRLRRDLTLKTRVNFVTVSDNLVRGAGLDAVEILQLIS